MVTTWQGALDYLYGLANWETRPPGTSVTFELDRIRALLDDLGAPHEAWPAIHVAGTNGKGSVCAMVAPALKASGAKTGLFTSPHLHTVRERIQVDGAMIVERDVIAWLNRNRRHLDRQPGLTTFEALTAMAFSHFRDQGVDVAVVEVGLGGRLDTTNVVAPVITAMTTIALDHTAVLGATESEIARDKAGIVKPGVPLVSAPQTPEVLSVLESATQRADASLRLVGRDIVLVERRPTANGQDLVIESRRGGRPGRHAVSIGLRGRHQAVNAAVAVGVLDLIDAAGALDVTDASIARGLSAATWPGRYEVLSRHPCLIVDGAHNPDAVRALAATLEEDCPDATVHLVFGASRDKDVAAMLDPLRRCVGTSIATASEHPRSMPAGALATTMASRGLRADVAATPGEALARALERAAAEDVVLVTGSVFVVADAREAFADLGGMPMPPRDPPPVR